MTDGGWQPNPTGFNDLPAMRGDVDIAQDFEWPAIATFLNTCSSLWSNCPYAPPNAEWWAFHMRQYLTWQDTAGTGANTASYINAMGYYSDIKDMVYSGSTTWGTYLLSEAQYKRFLLASTLLDNGYAQIHAGQYGGWCDECGVNLTTGRSELSHAATGWLGCPLDVARTTSTGATMRDVIDTDWQGLSDYVWKREFTNGLVVVNPGTTAVTVNIGTGWKRIYSPNGAASYNNGAAVTGNLTIPAMNAYVLLRNGAAAATATPTATTGSTATRTPTRTATRTPTNTATVTRTPTPTQTATSTPTWTSHAGHADCDLDNQHADLRSDCHTHADLDTGRQYGHAHGNQDTHGYTDQDAHLHPHGYANAHRDADTHGNRHAASANGHGFCAMDTASHDTTAERA